MHIDWKEFLVFEWVYRFCYFCITKYPCGGNKDCSNRHTSFRWLVCRSFMYNTYPGIMGQTIKLILNTIKTNILMVYNYIAMFMEYKTWWRPQDIETLIDKPKFLSISHQFDTEIAYRVQVICSLLKFKERI